MKIERATQLLFLLLISQGGNAAYANLPRGASASPVQVSAQANKITVSGTVVDVNDCSTHCDFVCLRRHLYGRRTGSSRKVGIGRISSLTYQQKE